MAILVCGGAGYIGSHNVRALLDRGSEAVVMEKKILTERKIHYNSCYRLWLRLG